MTTYDFNNCSYTELCVSAIDNVSAYCQALTKYNIMWYTYMLFLVAVRVIVNKVILTKEYILFLALTAI